MTPKRRAVSPIIATVIIIAIVIAGSGVVYAAMNGMITTQLSNDSVQIVDATISNVNDGSWITVSVKNDGTSEVNELSLEVKELTGDNTFDFDPATLSPGKSTSLTTKLSERVSEGTDVLIVITGNSTSGGTISETDTVRP